MPRVNAGPKTSRFVLLASVCVVVAALYFAQAVFIPLALAMLLSFLLAPLVARLEKWRIKRIPAVLIVVIALFSLIAVLGYVVGMQVYDLASNMEQYEGNIVAKAKAIHPRGGLIERFEKTTEEMQKKIEQPEKTSTTQTTQPSQRVAELAADEVAARTGQPRTITEKSLREGAAPPTTQWTKENPLPVAVAQPKESPLQTLGHYLGMVLGPLGTAGIVIVFVIFMLLSREDLRDRLIRLIASGGQLTVATQALDDASTRISRYLLAQAIVNGTYGIAISLGLWLIGITIGQKDPAGTMMFPNAVLWGLLCALLRFIPYIGPWIGAAFPMLVSLAVYQGFSVFVCVGCMFVLVELVSNNLMEPWLYGASTGMTTLAVLVSAVFWTWLWGPIGLLLSTPLTVVLVVLGKYVPQLQFLDVMLGDEPAMDPPTRIYQRLLALDSEEAQEVVEEYRKEMPLEQVYDTVLLPALVMAEQDRHRGRLDDRRQVFIRRSMREIIEEMGDQERTRDHQESAAATEKLARDGVEPQRAPGDGNGKPENHPVRGSDGAKRKTLPRNCVINVVCLPAHDEADEIANLMLAQLLELRGFCPQTVSPTALASEMIAKVEEHQADVVVVSALPPGAVAHARYLCKRVHARLPETKMSVGLWLFRGDLKRAKERMTCVASVQLVTTLSDMQDVIDQLAQPAMLREAPAAK